MTIRSDADLTGMTQVGRLVGLALEEMRAAVAPGITTAELDQIGATFLRKRGARSAPQLVYGFPGFTCISVNDEAVHGIPSRRALRPGDVVKLDVTAELGGYIADAAVTLVLPPAAPKARELSDCAKSAFTQAMMAARAGRQVAQIGRAVEREVRRCGFHVLRELGGHGVGRSIHERPSVPNYDDPRERSVLEEGMVITVEPILALEPTEVVTQSNGWTICTANGCLSTHYEHTIVVTHDQPIILTAA
ncbi:MAG: type I methionyl aminopeptidase [Acidobacteria bacterium]|nr:type I methionyl aminopeptidase [Acidobacteriota bacterium]